MVSLADRMTHYLFPQIGSLKDFVGYWKKAYDYENEPIYSDNIGKRLTRERVLSLFVWKNGRKLSAKKQKSVEENYVALLPEVARCTKDLPPEDFLSQFGKGGAIWDIFFLHLWQSKYPIFDQHVFRAMRFIKSGEIHELPASKSARVRLYLDEYLRFYSSLLHLCGSPSPRDIDKALWKFGQFLKWIEPPSEDDETEEA